MAQLIDGVKQHSHGGHGTKLLQHSHGGHGAKLLADGETRFCCHMKELGYGGKVFRPDAKSHRTKVDFYAGSEAQAHRPKLDFNAGDGGKLLCESEVGVARCRGDNTPKFRNEVGNVSCAVTGDGDTKQADGAVSFVGCSIVDVCDMGGQRSDPPCEAEDGTNQTGDAVSFVGYSRKGLCDMGGQRSEPPCEVDDGANQTGDAVSFVGCSRKGISDMGGQRSYEAELLCEVCDGQNVFSGIANEGKYDLEAGNSSKLSHDMRDVENLAWTSPRISFSQDFTITTNEESKGPAGEEEVHLADFEFTKDMSTSKSVHETKGFMLSADKLFSNGKLLPLHLSLEHWGSSMSACDDLCLSRKVGQHKLFSHDTPHQKPTARHLSFDMGFSHSCPSLGSTPSLSSLSPLSTSCSSSWSSSSSSSSLPSLSLSSSLSSSVSLSLSSKHSPPSSGLFPAEPSLNPVFPKSQSKYTAKIKELFKPKKFSSSVDNTVTSTRRLPISPRSFWPFSRSNSAGERKTVAPGVVPIPRRSNSAGERIGAGAGPNLEGPVDAVEATTSFSNLSNVGVPTTSVGQDSRRQLYGQSSSISSSSQIRGRPDQCRSRGSCSFEDVTHSAVMNGAMPNVRVHGYLGGRVVRRKSIASSGNFARCSPGRRGSLNSPGVRINAGKIVLRNLERCSAEKKLRRDGLKGSGRRSLLYSGTTMRVTPVLNVAVYKGKASQAGLFKFGGLFSRVKKPKGARLTNWRNGA